MTPPLRELAADIRPDDARSDVYAVSNAQLTAWADKLESLAAAQEAVPILLSDDQIHRLAPWVAFTHYSLFRAGYEAACLAMIEAAERQEAGR